jgi:TP901 family phage tail tape measure protein
MGDRLAAAMERNQAALANARGGLVDAVAGFYALKGAIAAPIKTAIDFETQLEDIGQKAGIPTERLAALGNEIKRVASDTNQATTDIASAVDNLLGRGAAENVALAAAGPIGKAATAYRAATHDLAAASWSAVDNLKVPADQIATAIDAMAQAGKEGAFELRDMAQYFPALGAAYQGLGQEGTDAVAGLAAALQIVRKGTGDSSTAATNLQNVLQKIGSPATLRAFKKMGVNLTAQMKKAGEAGLTPIEAIAEITNKTLKGDLGKLGFLFEDAQVQQGMRSLIQNMDEYRRVREAAMKASGVVDEDYRRRVETAAGATIRWKASIENLSIAIGTTLLPMMSDLVNRLTPVIDAIGQWTTANPVLARTALSAAAGLVAFKVATAGLKFVGLLGRGGALSMMALGFNTVGRAAIATKAAITGTIALQSALSGGQAYSGFAKLTDAARALVRITPGLSLVGPAVSAIGTALGMLSAPVIAGIAAVASAGVLIWKYWDRISSVFAGVGRALAEEFAPAIEAMRPVLDWLSPIGETIAAGWEKATEALSAFGEWIGSFFSREVLSDEEKAQWEQAGHDAATRMIEAIKEAFADLVAWAADLGARVGNAIANAATNALASIKAKASSILNTVTFGYAGTPTPDNDNSTGGTSGHRKRGGPVWPGGSFLVGEDGPEVITPKSGATVTPVSAAGSTGPISVTINVHGTNDPRETARIVEKTVEDAIRNAMRSVHADLGARA